uniref:ADP-ribosylglycohydrolase n=1 Tax=Candidatus Kentrum sp. MB TaxID=2138164 RepID=A0A450XKM5_9GAMM|nr:MAG: ADP-ribosylglycohydrolase [Candidatus Kentron sp. MB]VFK33900.1 MAG: ADP-ribosylglycohydrolase [Candidatus Kentron sp. MB]VFK76503.1 MAG: ADP-ribosylglycohydrolase [Candidatus Kentron sp. MB]
MLGAIAGDIIGSVYEYEWNNIKTKEFQLFSPKSFFTDDTVLTIALAETILQGSDYEQVMRQYYRRYPNAGYGGAFHQWASDPQRGPYNSWGNGSAMRTSPVGYAFRDLEKVLSKAAYFASFTHNHPEGIKGAQATASAIFLAENGASKEEIKSFIVERFGYDLSQSLDEIRPHYHFDVSCQGTVPQALIAFLQSVDYEDAIRNAVSLGGDSDTLACITGGVAEAFYGGVPEDIREMVMGILDDALRGIVYVFYRKYIL